MLHFLQRAGCAPASVLVSARDAALAGAFLVVTATCAQAQSPQTPGEPVVAVVRVPKPWYAPRALVVSRMRDTIPDYDKVPGLLFKAYSLERDSGEFGGLYFWRSREQAQAWFNPAWFERVRKERGAEGSVRFFSAVATLDNTPGGTGRGHEGSAVGTVVEIAVPAGVSRDRMVAALKAAVPEYQQVPGLLRKHFTLSDTGTFGGVYLWQDEASARAWFSPAWQERVQRTHGQAAKIEWFQTPILLPSADADNRAAVARLDNLKP
jgi:heme-degrading monooxygenase HmoA